MLEQLNNFITYLCLMLFVGSLMMFLLVADNLFLILANMLLMCALSDLKLASKNTDEGE